VRVCVLIASVTKSAARTCPGCSRLPLPLILLQSRTSAFVSLANCASVIESSEEEFDEERPLCVDCVEPPLHIMIST
jgi:hypothetical protein